MPAGNTYEAIATQTLGSNANTVQFTGISQDYTDLRIIVNPRSNFADRVSAFYFDLNGLTTSIYSRTNLIGNGSSVSSARASNQGLGQIGTITGANSTSNIFPTNTIDIMNYSNTTTFKTVLTRTNLEQPTAGFEVGTYVNLVRTTNAITSIKFYCVGDFVTGSTFSIYGIKAA